MKNMSAFIIALALLPLISADCAKDSEKDLFAKKWWLIKIYTKEGTRAIGARKPFIRFDKEKQSAGGNGGCNSFGSTLAVEKDSVSITQIFSTKMYCEGVQAMEDLFLNDLAISTRYEIKGNNLFLYRGEELLLEFEGEEMSN